LDRQCYKQRHAVERLMNGAKQLRTVVTRCSRLAVRYWATIAVADVFSWLPSKSDQPARSLASWIGQ